MNFKVKGEGEYTAVWFIYNNDKEVARIELFDGFRTKSKSLYVNKVDLGRIKNQKEALEKLEKFFIQNKADILELENQVVAIKNDINNVISEFSVNALNVEIDRLHKELEKLRANDLV